MLSIPDIVDCLAVGYADGQHRERLGDEVGALRAAAVLLPLFVRDGDWHLLFIRRAEHEADRHSGEVAFPGGQTEPEDADAVATALREAEEEIGLGRERVEVLGTLKPVVTVSRFEVTPVAGRIDWPAALLADPREVAEIFSMPITWLRDPSNHEVRIWPSSDHPEARELVFFEEYQGRRLWGVSARITLNLLACLERRGGCPGVG